MNPYIEKIHQLAKQLPHPITIMEVCGGHTNTIMKYGIRDLLPANIRLISGPGCPVCVTDQKDIDNMIALAEVGVQIATYGDMLRVPGSGNKSLASMIEEGADIKVILSVEEILNEKDKNRVFFGIGFETTTPMTAFALKNGVTVYSAHKTMPEPMKFLVETSDINGFIDPGHVSAITGEKIWHNLEVAQVISGFKPEQIIRGIYKLLELIVEGKKSVINDYTEVVSYEGNLLAQNLIAETMQSSAALWRGMGKIPNSGLEPKENNLNAKIKFAKILKNVSDSPLFESGCRCGEILQGKCEPKDCPFFGKSCTPKNPLGACMVSENEGACGIAYKFKNC